MRAGPGRAGLCSVRFGRARLGSALTNSSRALLRTAGGPTPCPLGTGPHAGVDPRPHPTLWARGRPSPCSSRLRRNRPVPTRDPLSTGQTPTMISSLGTEPTVPTQDLLGSGQTPTVNPSQGTDPQRPPETLWVLESDVPTGHSPVLAPGPTGDTRDWGGPHAAQPGPGDRHPADTPFPPTPSRTSPCTQPCSTLPARDTTDGPQCPKSSQTE